MTGDSADGIAPSSRHVEHIIRPERPNFRLGCPGSGIVNQCFGAVRDTLGLETAEVDTPSEVIR
jgi:hypothetical protein